MHAAPLSPARRASPATAAVDARFSGRAPERARFSPPKGARPKATAALLLSPALLLAACGGAGGPGPTSLANINPPPVAAPAEPTSPPPDDTYYKTAEYRRSAAVGAANALPAWQAGVTGKGVVIGIIDSGLSNTTGEFDGRIAAASRDVTGQGRAITDESGHGTAVSAIAAAARNDSGIVGIAPEATIAMMRADNGDCSDGCRFADEAIAAGLDAATRAGARVINISLGGSNGGAALRNAFRNAAAADRVIVVSAGNDAADDVDPLALAALAAAGSTHVLVAGAADKNGDLADFSNRAGSAQDNYLMALGERVQSFDHTGTTYLYSGTSMAAPIVSAAVALLAQAFPDLSAANIVAILLDAADDRGAAGVDATYGHGLLNIGKAMAPSGSLSLAGTKVPVPFGDTGALGGAFGDGLARASALENLPVIDSYGRAYRFNATQSLRLAPAGRLAGRLQDAGLFSSALATGNGRFSLALELRSSAAPGSSSTGRDIRVMNAEDAPLGLAQRGMDAHAAARNPFRETRVRIAAPSGFSFVAATGRLASESLPGSGSSGFVADDGFAGRDGTGTHGQLLLMGSRKIGKLTFALAAQRRAALLPAPSGAATAMVEQKLSFGAELQQGVFTLALAATDRHEQGALFGTRLAPGYGLGGGHGQLVQGAISWSDGETSLRLAGQKGRTEPAIARGALLADGGALASASWSITATRALPLPGASGAFASGRLSFRLAAPLAITGGHFLLANGATLAAAPRARERAAELGYEAGAFRLALFQRRNAGNIMGLGDRGGAFSFRARF